MNQIYPVDGFWTRLQQVCKDIDMPVTDIADTCGLERKSFYPEQKHKTDRSWHSGKLYQFCHAFGVSADWLLGLSNRKYLKSRSTNSLTFKIIDTKTGKEPILDGRHIFREKWFKDAASKSPRKFNTIVGWGISPEGDPVLVDLYGNTMPVPNDRFIIRVL